VERFFTALGKPRCALITHISSDAAEWIIIPAELHCPNATICLDPFHIVGWATAALDKVRREVWNRVRRAGLRDEAREIKDSRWALLKNPEDLTEKQSRKLAVIAQVNDPLYRAYLLKEQLRMIFRVPYEQAQVGSPLPHRALRQAGADYHLLPPGHRGDAAPWGQQRKLGVGQHEDPLDRPESFRVSLRQGADRALRAHARRAMPVTAWPPVSYPRMCQKTRKKSRPSAWCERHEVQPRAMLPRRAPPVQCREQQQRAEDVGVIERSSAGRLEPERHDQPGPTALRRRRHWATV
jgi:hypothetical protein